MNTQYTVWTASELKTGEVAVSSVAVGPFLAIGQSGRCGYPRGKCKNRGRWNRVIVRIWSLPIGKEYL